LDYPKTVISIEQYKEGPVNLIVVRSNLNMFTGNKLERVSDNKITQIGRL